MLLRKLADSIISTVTSQAVGLTVTGYICRYIGTVVAFLVADNFVRKKDVERTLGGTTDGYQRDIYSI